MPKYIDFSYWNNNLENIEIKNSRLFSLLYSNKEYDTNRDLSFNRNIENKYSNDGIIIVNAHENNLKNVNITIPYSKINAIIGVSGSGKSSLVDDTIYKECQRRMEYLNRNRALFVKPNVDAIKGVLPAIRIKQDPIRGSIMSTVGTYTNSYEPLRILFSTIGLRHCPECGEEIIPLTEWKIEELITKNDLDIYDINKNQIKLGLIKECVHKALEDGLGALYTKIDDEFVLL